MSEVPDEDSAPPPSSDPIAPLRIALRGRYEFERQIGQGAFATVYLARDLKHERKVAIKVLNADPTSETGEIRFIREIRLVARLQHPNILPLHDSGHVEALLYYVMPFVEGETLRVRMHRERQMAVEAACAIARETADALAYAHKQGIVHRDIKPENILLSGGHAVVADFGIARAIDVAGVRQLTATGVAGPGTPAYMSPEQLLGDRAVDARSDIYSLGCVLYEMLVARPPYSGKDGFVKRFTEPPAHISSLRRDAPPWLDKVIAKALSKDPDDRYTTGADFVAALHPPTSTTRTPARHTPLKNALVSPPLFETDPLEAQEMAAAFPGSYPSGGEKAPSRFDRADRASLWQRSIAVMRAHPLASGISGIAVTFAAGALIWAPSTGSLAAMFGTGTAIDSTRFVVLSSTGFIGPSDVGSQVADSLYDAFMRWEGLPVAPSARVAQAIADGAARPTTEGEVLSLARRMGAGRAVWVQTSGDRRSPRVRIHLYDAKTAERIDEFGVPTTQRGEEFYTIAVQRLLGLGDRPRNALGCDGATRSFPAWSACNAGHIALARWNIAAAERSFSAAVAADSSYAPARLWLGQLTIWRPQGKRDASYDLVRTLNESDLSTRDRLAAAGLTALLEQRFPSACAAYAQLVKLDSVDFLGWYGLGECQAADSMVVRSTASPSGWAFRGSWHSAVAAFLTALRLEPGAHEIFDAARLRTLMPVSATLTRAGVGAPPERAQFRAYPSLEPADTVGFVPYQRSSFASIRTTAANQAALRRNTTLLHSFTNNWASRFPRSARAQEALADALEAQPDLGDGPPRASAALRAIDSAIVLLRESDDAATRARDEIVFRARKVRVHFKRGEFAPARILSDSILAISPVPGTERDLVFVAALTGRADLAARYWQGTLRTGALTGGTPPPVVAAPASKYFAYAALGVCGAKLAAAESQLESALRDYVAGDIREALRSDLKDRAASLATPCTAGASVAGIRKTSDRLSIIQQAYARKDARRVGALLAAAAADRAGKRPGDTSVDYLFHEAWLRTQIGDTAGAENSLDAMLGALPTFGAAMFRDLPISASFGRAMVLRAEIAAKRGDTVTAKRWAGAIARLWASAEPPLRSVSLEMARLANGTAR